MPELPEVEATRKYLERALKGKRLTDVEPDPEDRIVYDQATPEEVRKALVGRKVIGAGRKGKYFWLKLDRRPWPVIHLGMTGNVEIQASSKSRKKNSRSWDGVRLWHAAEKDGSLPFIPFCRLLLRAEDGTQVALTDPRRFGRVRLAEDPEKEPPISKLGFDPLLSFPSAKELEKILSKRRAPIKAVLLDQKIFAGVGNWIADEVLFQAKVSPHRLASKLSAKEIATLRAKLLGVIRKSVSLDADYNRYPRGWLFHHRWGKKKDAETYHGHKIAHDEIGGRTTAWVPALQK